MQPSGRWLDWQKGFVLPRPTWQKTFALGNQLVTAQSWGRGDPLLLVPGLAGGLPLMAPLVRELTQDFQVVGVEVREEHRILGDRKCYGLVDLADDLVAKLDHLKIESLSLIHI
jgi:hypothetical protein